MPRPPLLPLGLSLLLATQAPALTLRWDPPASGEPTGYTLYRGTVPNQACSTSATPPMLLYGVAPVGTAPQFRDDTPSVGSNYYEVTAYNSEGESLPSNRVCFQRQAAPPSPPLSLRIDP